MKYSFQLISLIVCCFSAQTPSTEVNANVKRKLRISILLLFSLSCVFCQNTKDDARNSSLDSLVNLARSYTTSSPDSLLKYGRIILNESKIINNPYYKAHAYRLLGIGYSIRKVHHDSSAYFYKQALSLADDQILRGDIYQSQAGLFYDMGLYEEALSAFLECVEIFKEKNITANLANAYGGIGNVFIAQEQYQKALEYLIRCKQIAEENNHINTLLPALANIATINLRIEKYDSAITYAEECYQLCNSLDIKYGVAKSAQILAESWSKKKDFKKSIDYSKEARSIFEQMEATGEVTAMQITEANALNQLGDHQEALRLLKEVEMKMDDQIPQLKLSFLEAIKNTYNQMGRKELAYQYFENYFALFKEVNETSRNNHIQELEIAFETKQKEEEIIRLTQENEIKDLKNNQQVLIFVVILVFLMLMVISVVFILKQRITKKDAQIAIRKEQLLRSQINPHFIFNSLSSIRGFLFSGGDTKPAITYLGKFAKLMRMVLELSSKEWVSLAEEVKALELYLEIQQIRFNKAFDFKFSIDPSLDQNEIIVPPLTAQPFIENAIEHGLKGMDSDGKVEITCLKQHGKLVFKILDNGIGIDHVEPRKNHQSLATQIFKERLSLIGKRMKTSFSFSISDIGNDADIHGTLVTYELPLIKA